MVKYVKTERLLRGFDPESIKFLSQWTFNICCLCAIITTIKRSDNLKICNNFELHIYIRILSQNPNKHVVVKKKKNKTLLHQFMFHERYLNIACWCYDTVEFKGDSFPEANTVYMGTNLLVLFPLPNFALIGWI